MMALINTAAYSGSKGAIVKTTRLVAIDYAKHRIHCNALSPGCQLSFFEKTNRDADAEWEVLDTKTAVLADAFKYMGDQKETSGAMHPFRGLGQAEALAGPAVFLASNDPQWITGVPLIVDGGFTAQQSSCLASASSSF